MAETIPIPNEFDNSNDFWTHPLYDNYESNRDGIIRNVKLKKPLGIPNSHGYYKISVYDGGKIKKYYNHRFIYECFHGLITDGRVIDHINNIKTDNRLQNLQAITQRENVIKDNIKRRFLPPVKIKAINVKTGESTDYGSINKASKDLIIDSGIICHLLNGHQRTSLSKKYGQRFTFEKI